MSQSSRPRFAIDLDEIERQLQSTGPGAQQPAPAPQAPGREGSVPTHRSAAPSPGPSRNDPLAELARIVGQDDPFGTLLASDRTTAPERRTPPTFDELFPRRGEPIGPVASAESWHDPAAPHDGRFYQEPAEPTYDGHYRDDQASAHAARADDRPYGEQAYDEDEEAQEPPAPRNSRKAVIAAASVLGVAALSVGGVLLFGGKGSAVTGEPPLVMATAGPTKVQPQSPGGVEIPNQNKQIYERAAHETQTKVVSREEQPVDVRQAARMAAPAPDAATTGSATAAPANATLGEPKRVRTISIRPDGTVVPDPAPATPAPTRTAAASMPTAMTLPPAVQAPATPAATPPAQPPRTAAPAPSTQATSTPAPRAVSATPAAPTGGASPQAAEAPPAPKPQRVAAVQPTAAPTSTPATAAAEASVGGFSVQLGVGASEAEARASLQDLQRKYADLGGQPALIRKAEVNGNTVYRVRVGPMSKDDASTLCTKLQGSGGKCFVAKN